MNEPTSQNYNNPVSTNEGSINQQGEHSTIGGGQQASLGNDNIQIYNQIDISSLELKNRTLEDRVNQLQKEVRDFQGRYEQILNAFERFRNIALEQLENLSPEETDTKLALTELLAKTFQYQLGFEKANNAAKACREASEWLSLNRNTLVSEAKSFIEQDEQVRELKLSSIQLNHVYKTIELYLFWVGNEMQFGRKPNQIPEEIVLNLPNEYYVKYFELIKRKIHDYANDLSQGAVSYLLTYITRFIINPLSLQ